MIMQPFFDDDVQFPEFSFIRAENCQVINVPHIIPAHPTLSDQLIEWLKNRVRKPLGCVGPDFYAVFYNGMNKLKYLSIFDDATHPIHNNFRGNGIVKMPDITAKFILCSLNISVDPFFNRLFSVMNSTTRNTPGTVWVHPSHKCRLQNLYQCMVNVLIRPLHRLTNGPHLPGTGIPSFRYFCRFWYKSIIDYFP